MLNFKNSELQQLVVHHVGNKTDNEGIKTSSSETNVDKEIKLLLNKFFLKPFKPSSFYQFAHSSDIGLNEIYNYASSIFTDPESLFLQSINIAKHLYDCSTHPMIKGGELYICLFEDCVIEDEVCDAIGIFKSENKETYLKVYPSKGDFTIEKEEGININKLDKGCLIFDTEKDQGYKVAIIDNTNKGEEARYWKDDFLGLKPCENTFYHTKNYINLCKDFVEETFAGTAKVDQLDLVNNSVEYFNNNEQFNIREFEEKVMQAPEIISSFETYKEQYAEEKQIPVYDEFDISAPAVKYSKKFIRSVIKLDKNFHVYVHGNSDKIEKGYDDETQQHFYTLYFKEES